MTLKFMIETVRQIVPDLGRTQIVFDINQAMREFCLETGILSVQSTLSRTTDYSSTSIDGVETWTLPATLYHLLQVEELFRDAYEVVDDKLKFHPMGKFVDTLTIRYTKLPVPITGDPESPEYPAEFHEALVNKVLSKYYRKTGDGQNASVELALYKEAERAAKRYVNSTRYRNVSVVQGDDMGKIVAFGTIDLPEGVYTIPLGKTFTSITSFVFIPGSNDVDEYDPNLNFDQRTTSSVKVVSPRAVTNFQFYAYGT